ncbi:MAG TPA: uroporphyrinogen-III synthase [Ktedonobacteraceae bacterium]|nr:uroporphyrinogen-III synthase [Ktedonobacteraceae bacterium]
MPEHSVKALPLHGRRILVTRASEQAEAFSERLRALGAIPVEFATIRIVPPEDWEPLDDALRRLCGAGWYDWLVFTSVNGVRTCFERLRSLGYPAPGNVRTAAIGPATAAALAHYGITADLVPGEYIAESVAAALIDDAQRRNQPLAGKRVLLARAAEARNVLVSELQGAGAVVDVVAAYRTEAVSSDDERGREVLRMLEARQLDILTFTSSSTVRNFMYWLRQCETGVAGSLISLVKGNARPKIACIGPVTSQTAREFGLHVRIEAQEFTIAGLVEAIIRAEEKS